MSHRAELVKQFYDAFANMDRNQFVEHLLAPNFTFSAPPDPFLDRDGFFNICWPQRHNLKNPRYTRLIEHGNEVIVTHEYTLPNGATGRNTDILTFNGNQITRLEVYFGWETKEIT